MPLIVLGVYAHPVRDPNRVRYWVAKVQLESLDQAIRRYRADCAEYPAAEIGIEALVVDPGVDNWSGPYLERVPLDPWRRSYVYRRSSSTAEVLSYGADGVAGGDFFSADLSSLRLPGTVPESPYERRWNCVVMAGSIAALGLLCGSCWVLARVGLG